MPKFDYQSLSYLVQHSRQEFPVQWNKIFTTTRPLEVEIGFGLGEVLVRNALDRADRNFIGIEQNWERIYKCLKTAIKEENSLENLKILKIDARQAFRWLFDEKSIQSIYCLFPCPWPKKAHAKYRLFSQDFLKLLNNRLVEKGDLKIVTDYFLYAKWIEEQLEGTGFLIKHKKINPQFDTKFEKKWCSEGQEEFFELYFSKKKHVKLPLVKEVKMKSYKLKEFDINKFHMKDLKGEISVIHKDTVCDCKKNKVLIHMVVSEEKLTQHFWAIISKDKGYWQINKVDGQTFFPTPGIAKALEHVHQCAVGLIK